MPVVHHRAPISNRERQRQFRARNPGYFKKYNARAKASRRAAKAANEAYRQARKWAAAAPLFAELIMAPHRSRLATAGPSTALPANAEDAERVAPLPLFDDLDTEPAGYSQAA
ncbi:MAG: hypothetical protein AAGF84_06390 [Planctomycetota bacterium]